MNSGRPRGVVSGLYAVTPDDRDTETLLRLVDAALAGGARVVQYRNKTAAPDRLRAQALALKTVCERYRRPLIINDHVGLAAEIEAAGVHIGVEDGSVGQARTMLGPHSLIGVSCYDSLERAREAVAAGADYVAFGSFFPSTVKPKAVKASLELLRAARAELDVPLVAIGGITTDNAPELLAAGADAVAVISSVFAAADVARAARAFALLFSDCVVTER